MTNLIVFGASGRMGGTILGLASRDSQYKIAGAVESLHHASVGKKILDGKVAVTSDLDSLKGEGLVAIDFTAPAATLAHLELLSGWKKSAAVIGTTGFSDREKSEIEEFAEKMPIVFSPNMSRGVNLMLGLVRDAAKKLEGYNIELVESHHNQKKDAPSGTALALAKEIAGEIKRNPTIHSIRAGDIVGEHTVLFAAGGEQIEIKHVATSRDAFAHGALHAAKWVSGKKPGLYSMQDVLEK